MRKWIKIPIYNTQLLVVKGEDFEKLHNEFKLELEFENYEALTFEYKGNIVVFFKDNVSLNVLVHESVHVCSFLYYLIGAKKDIIEDEHEAYITAWVVEQIDKFINKK